MASPTIADPMRRLSERFVGTWRGDERLFPTPWDPAGGAAIGTWTVRPGAGGACLVVDYVEERDGAVAYQGHGVHGHDAETGQLHASWCDSAGTMWTQAVPATFADDRYTYTRATARGLTRFTYAWRDDELTFTIARSDDGATWAPMHEGRYRRA